MGPLAHRLSRFLVFAAVMGALVVVIALTQAPDLAGPVRTLSRTDVSVPALGSFRLITIVRCVAGIAVPALLAAACGRLLGRRLRHPAPLSSRWPLRNRLARLQAQLRPVPVELILARDALAEPYEIAKLADGLAPILRSQRRFHLGRLLGPDSLILSQRAHAETHTVSFQLSAPARAHPAILARLQATYPGLRTQPATADPLTDGTVSLRQAICDRLQRRPVASVDVEVVRMKKQRSWIWSLQTTKDYTHSTIDALVHQLHAVARSDNNATVQLILTPTPARVERRAGRKLRRRERGLRAQTGQAGTEPGIESVTAQKDLKGALEGVGRAYYWFDWQILAPRGRHDLIDAITGALAELRQDNELRPRHVRLRRRLTIHRAAVGLRPLMPSGRTGALSAAEIASCWHLPSARVKGVGLHRQPTRQAPASHQISRDPRDMLLHDEHGPVGIRPADRRKGLAVLGAAGGGKSSLLLRYIGNVARDPERALIVVDLKEDLARDALTVIPADRRVQIIDLHHPQIGINILAIDQLAPEVRADILIAAIREIHGEDSVGPRSDSLLRAAITAVCIAQPTPTLAHVLRILDPYDPGYRDWIVRELTYHHEVDFVRDFWEREFPAMIASNPRFVAEAVAAPRNKLQRFLAVPSLALVTNHPVPVDLVRIIRDREVLVVNGSKEAVGETNAALFCQLVVLLVQKALHRLQALERQERTPVALVIDEAHNVFTPSFATMLSEGRSAGLETVAAFQYTGQITDERVRSGVKSLLQNISITRMREFEDARAFASLAMELFSDAIRVDPDDQRKLALDPIDIINAPDHRVLNLWLANGTPQPAFTADTIAIEPTVDRSGRRDAREHHQHEQARRGHHPHDHGQPITPPLIWDARVPAVAQYRQVHVDLTAWIRRPDPVEILVLLATPDGPRGYRAHPADSSGRRHTATVPTSAADPGHLPAGVYPLTVLATDDHGQEHRWIPTVDMVIDQRKGTIRRDPVTVELTDADRRP